MNEVISAIRSGDAARVSRHLDEVVRITMDDKSHAYGRGQAEMILRDFFSGRGVKAFSIEQKGNNRETEFFLGGLTLGDDSRFRMSVYLKERSGRRHIQEIRLESLD